MFIIVKKVNIMAKKKKKRSRKKRRLKHENETHKEKNIRFGKIRGGRCTIRIKDKTKYDRNINKQ